MDQIEGFKLIKFGEIDSTNKESVRRISALQLSDKSIICSDIQNIGYGKDSRKWYSPAGNLYASISIKTDLSFEFCKQYSFITALSIRQAVGFYVEGQGVLCKWPNDVLVDGEKISGILLESLQDSRNQKWLIIGLGLNVNTAPKVQGKKVTSLKDLTNKEQDISVVLQKIVYYFQYYESIFKQQGFERIKEIWLKYCYKLNEIIEVSLQNKKYKGKFLGIDDFGSLLLKINGQNISFQSCDVEY